MADRRAPGDPALAGVRTRPARPKAEKRRPSAFWPLGAILVPFLRVAADLRLVHPERLPATGGYILTPNHLSNIDPVVVAVAVWRVGRAPRFLAKASLFRVPVFGGMLKATGQIPVQRGGTRAGVPLDAARRLIEQGQGVIVYPEGSLTRDPDLWPMRGRSGAARLALELGLPVIPCAQWGSQALMPVNTTKLVLRGRPRIDVLFGEPVDLGDLANDRVGIAAATDRIMSAITALLQEERGAQAPAERWNPAAHGQTETGTF